jgi:rubrerythrin
MAKQPVVDEKKMEEKAFAYVTEKWKEDGSLKCEVCGCMVLKDMDKCPSCGHTGAVKSG